MVQDRDAVTKVEAYGAKKLLGLFDLASAEQLDDGLLPSGIPSELSVDGLDEDLDKNLRQ